jgi:hypothetical protein
MEANLTIKTVDQPAEQTRLFEEPDLIKFPTLASARNRFGDAAEEIACKALNLCRIPVDGRFDVCFDAQDARGRFYEIKSVRFNSSIPLWNWRIKKDRQAGVPLSYVIVCHDTGGVKDTRELWAGLAGSVREILIVPLGIMEGLHSKGKLVKPRTSLNHGSMRKGYRDGYRLVPVKKLANRLHAVNLAGFKLYGHEFNLTVKTLL